MRKLSLCVDGSNEVSFGGLASLASQQLTRHSLSLDSKSNVLRIERNQRRDKLLQWTRRSFLFAATSCFLPFCQASANPRFLSFLVQAIVGGIIYDFAKKSVAGIPPDPMLPEPNPTLPNKPSSTPPHTTPPRSNNQLTPPPIPVLHRFGSEQQRTVELHFQNPYSDSWSTILLVAIYGIFSSEAEAMWEMEVLLRPRQKSDLAIILNGLSGAGQKMLYISTPEEILLQTKIEVV
ncbi:MAG: hypothetical protein KIT00_00180 [Rhodospirillales bacterium]|nr:hypothetical protein [Rhodospirillales bacterium]